MAAKKTTTTEPAGESGEELPKLADEQNKAVEEAEASAKEGGGGNPVRDPDSAKTPIPGTTGDLDVVSTDEATSLNPNVVTSGTKPDGKGGQVLLDEVDPAVANAALLGPSAARKPQSPSIAPDANTAPPPEGKVRFECTADNEPFCEHGPMKKGETYLISQEEADVLSSLNAGHVVGSSSSASDSNARAEGSDVE